MVCLLGHREKWFPRCRSRKGTVTLEKEAFEKEKNLRSDLLNVLFSVLPNQMHLLDASEKQNELLLKVTRLVSLFSSCYAPTVCQILC